MSLLLLPFAAQAGTYTPPTPNNPASVYSGGTVTRDGSASPYDYNGSTYNGIGITMYRASSLQCAGTITATWNWSANNANDLPPQNVIIMQTSSVSASDGAGTGSASCADGLGGAFVPDHPLYPNEGGTAHSTVYSVMSGGSTVSVNCTPSASASDTNMFATNVVNVRYSATISPVTINLTGTTPDAIGNANILVGQGCGASLSGIPAALLNNTAHPPTYQWSVSGITFQQWSPTTPAIGNAPANPNASYFVGGYGPSTKPSAHWYWNDLSNATETVSCTATLTPPAGQGAAFSVTVTKTVSVQVPNWVASETGGYMQVNPNAPNQHGAICLYAGPLPGQSGGGMNWSANVMSSVLFTSGTIELIQLVTPNLSYITYTGVGVPGVTHSDPENGQFGLDTSYPYPWVTTGSYQPPYTPTLYKTNDSPTIGLSSGIASATMQHQFTDYLLFLPPGTDSQWVPLGTATWSTNGNATVPTTDNWADYATQNGSDAAGTVTPTVKTDFTAGNTFPSWTRINVFPSF